jgi:probable addiction module antidote protein
MRPYRNYEESLKARLQDTDYAREYLCVALSEYEEDGDIEAFLLAVRDVAEAQGGMSKLSERISLTRQSLYKALSENGNPHLKTMGEILHGLGFKLSIEPLEDRTQADG